MYVQRIGRWAEALRHSLHRVYEPTTRTPVPWMLSGEAALALQGVDVEPTIVEFRAISAFAVAYFSGFMRHYEVPANAATVIYRRGGSDAPSEGWRSNVHQRIVAWSREDYACWLGRWNVDGFAVQVSYARGAEGDPVTEVDREDMRRVHFDGMEVPVVPLEFLLADSAARSQPQTTNRILHVLRCSGYDTGTLNRAMDALPSDKAMRLLRLLEIRLVAG
jgi:hypothetical protein